MRDLAKQFRWYGLVAGLVAAFVTVAAGEFYRYEDERGVAHFVDDAGRIPPRYLPSLRTYREKYDHLAPRQRAFMIQKQQRANERMRAERREQLEQESLRAQQEKERLRQIALVRLETPIELDANGSILVPVKLIYGRFHLSDVKLLLDTGASRIVVYQALAERLGLRKYQTDEARVAGGGLIPVGRARLDAIKVGPFELNRPEVLVLRHSGPQTSHHGLLGMNFIRQFHPTIDLEKMVIRWRTAPAGAPADSTAQAPAAQGP